ncbi:nitrite reductase (NAD(P)H) [Kocuria coralli]|uniref:assimilatory sulfite reductase (ferredoxin) n=1 Tax=Kocuria coralli TaxID=1461025 RepID=A0A5J5KVZ2_9MICC|nr:nitrite reductase large subunit NirB [Kocuria coralli]KAA9393754.1 nitrite reductase (NAD(P)H) [Kocuria coralli]
MPHTPAPGTGREILVIGGGPAAHRLVQKLIQRGLGEDRVTVLAEEPWSPYDRVALETLFNDPYRDLSLGGPEFWEHPQVTLHTDMRASDLDVKKQVVHTRKGLDFPYHELVLATGSSAATLNIPGAHRVHVFRTVEDVRGIVEEVAELRRRLGRTPRGVVVGGGLLGLEAAAGLKDLGAEATILDVAEFLLCTQMDRDGGLAVNSLMREQGLDVRCQRFIAGVELDDEENVVGVIAKDGPGDDAAVERIPADMVVLGIGIKARSGLARRSGFHLGARGGVVVDEACKTSVAHVWAIGEVADILGQTWGLVGPANIMAEVVADRLFGGDARVTSFDTSTRLKFSGVDVASFGDVYARTPGCIEVNYTDPVAGIYQKIVVGEDQETLLGGVFVGNAEPYDALRPLQGRPLPAEPARYLSAAGGDAPETELPDDAILCSCNNVSFGTVREAVRDGSQSVPELKACTNAGTQCGSCVPMLQKTMEKTMLSLGLTVSKALCEHFEMSRQDLYAAVRASGIRTFPEALERFGRGRDGCLICKPVMASILSSQPRAYVLDEGRGSLQDTNDRNLGNMQKDGTYSVVPRIPGGEVTPEKLAVIASVAEDYGLYTKITGAQRIGLYGARLEELPEIWKRFVDAGFESGQAYGKALRNVKSCIGSAWCRFGVQDSVAMGIKLENRYRGLRSPHKFKIGSSGCARDCAEAQGKDIGVMATPDGWTLYLGGNGGANPAHGRVIAQDIDEDALVSYIDRYLMYYIRTADKLQRTARWLEDLDEEYGDAMAHLKSVLIDDSLGICEDLDQDMQRQVEGYEDEWAATLKSPERLRRFRPFVNEPQARDDSSRQYVLERDQIRPATREEIEAAEAGDGPVLISGARIPVGGTV